MRQFRIKYDQFPYIRFTLSLLRTLEICLQAIIIIVQLCQLSFYHHVIVKLLLFILVFMVQIDM